MNSYRIKKERERILFSSLLVLGCFLVLFLGTVILNLFKFEDFTDYSGPVKITFGTPESTSDERVEAEAIEKEVVEDVEPVIEEPQDVPEDITPVEEYVTEEIVPEPTKPEPVLEPVVEPKEVVKPQPVTPPEPPKPIVQKGQESGNSYEASFDSTSSKIGLRAYFPIWQFMPLPKTISMDVYYFIDGDITGFGEPEYNKKVFERYYENVGGEYKLKNSVNLGSRPEVWGIIEDAGYNIENPEYKEGKKLKSVVITFEIDNNLNGSSNINSAEINSSSGYPDIDEAVLYGFRQSTYSNSTNNSVKGRFQYTFNNP